MTAVVRSADQRVRQILFRVSHVIAHRLLRAGKHDRLSAVGDQIAEPCRTVCQRIRAV